jgi:Fic family protein
MEDRTSQTPPPEENKLGLTTAAQINEAETEGVARVQAYLLTIPTDVEITAELLKQLHATAFGHIYDWAGDWWKRDGFVVGEHIPPPWAQVPLLMRQFEDNLKFRMPAAQTEFEQLVDLIAEAHHRLVWIHPFVNGNGRMARFVSDLIALKCGETPFTLYVREAGELRSKYIQAIRQADRGDFTALRILVRYGLLRSRGA